MERIRDFFRAARGIISFLAVIALLLFVVVLVYEIFDITDSTARTVVLATAAVICLFAFLFMNAFGGKVLFNGEDLLLEKKFLGIKVKSVKYLYSGISKFIFSKNYSFNLPKRYSLYIDINDKIIKLISLSSYSECFIIMGKIKSIAKKLYVDATDENYFSEEDMFRNYYKMKKLMDEVKNENGNISGSLG
jgi:hypothetical protein